MEDEVIHDDKDSDRPTRGDTKRRRLEKKVNDNHTETTFKRSHGSYLSLPES